MEGDKQREVERRTEKWRETKTEMERAIKKERWKEGERKME